MTFIKLCTIIICSMVTLAFCYLTYRNKAFSMSDFLCGWQRKVSFVSLVYDGSAITTSLMISKETCFSANFFHLCNIIRKVYNVKLRISSIKAYDIITFLYEIIMHILDNNKRVLQSWHKLFIPYILFAQ